MLSDWASTKTANPPPPKEKNSISTERLFRPRRGFRRAGRGGEASARQELRPASWRQGLARAAAKSLSLLGLLVWSRTRAPSGLLHRPVSTHWVTLHSRAKSLWVRRSGCPSQVALQPLSDGRGRASAGCGLAYCNLPDTWHLFTPVRGTLSSVIAVGFNIISGCSFGFGFWDKLMDSVEFPERCLFLDSIFYIIFFPHMEAIFVLS